MNRDWWLVPEDRFASHTPTRVRYNEIDHQGIVFNGNYLIYADIGVTELFRALGEGTPGPFFAQYGTDIVMVNAEIDYHASARLDEMIVVAARVARFGRTSFTIHVGLFRDDGQGGRERLTDMALTYAHVEQDLSKAVPLPAMFIADVRSFQPDPPEQAVAKA